MSSIPENSSTVQPSDSPNEPSTEQGQTPPVPGDSSTVQPSDSPNEPSTEQDETPPVPVDSSILQPYDPPNESLKIQDETVPVTGDSPTLQPSDSPNEPLKTQDETVPVTGDSSTLQPSDLPNEPPKKQDETPSVSGNSATLQRSDSLNKPSKKQDETVPVTGDSPTLQRSDSLNEPSKKQDKTPSVSEDSSTLQRSDSLNEPSKTQDEAVPVTGDSPTLQRSDSLNEPSKKQDKTPAVSGNSSTSEPSDSSNGTLTEQLQTPNKPNSICNKYWCIMFVIIIILVEPLIIWYLIKCPQDSTYMNSADKSEDAYNDFNSYYGISPSKNYFTIANEDTCKCGIVFKSVFPSSVVDLNNSPSSFMILSDQGTGKTFLRCLYLNNLKSKDYLKILISNAEVHEYFDRFVLERDNGLQSVWSEKEFNQLILSVATTQLVNLFNEEQFQLPKISLNEKLELLTIICYYYNDLSIDKLERFVNIFLEKSAESQYTANTMRSQILERNIYKDKPLLIHFKRDLNKLNIISQNSKKLELLLDIMEGEGYQNWAIDKAIGETVFQNLIKFTQFMKNNVKRPVVFVIDNIQENRFCFSENTNDKLSLDLFYRSSLTSEILSSVLAKKFYIALFYLNINTIEKIRPKDKFPIYTIEWNTQLLINYADFVLTQMNKDASNDRFKQLPHFKQLINYSDPAIVEIIKQIQTPKHLHLFMKRLIEEMNKSSKDVKQPFIATYHHVQTAFQQINNYL